MRLKTFNGAPLCERLDFSEDTLLEAETSCDSQAIGQFASPSENAPLAKWRAVTTTGHTRLRTEWSQPYLYGPSLPPEEPKILILSSATNEPSAFHQDDISALDTTLTFDDTAAMPTDLLEHSFVFHDTLLSSQVLQDAGADDTIASASFLTASFGTTMSDFGSPSRIEDRALCLQLSPRMSILSLGSLPSAQQLRSMYPQTPTPNLLCALVNNPKEREVLVRKGGYKMNLWELTVADDTRSDFRVSFWLRPRRDSNSEHMYTQNLLLQTLGRTRLGDVVLLRNIALTPFRDVVYGQSLNPTITRVHTSVDILLSSSGAPIPSLSGLPAIILETFKRVRKWAKLHVVADSGGTRKREDNTEGTGRHNKRPFSSTGCNEYLPPDTMESA